MSMNFMNKISDTQKQLTRIKDILTLIWHQEVSGEVAQPKIKLQMSMVQAMLADIEEMVEDGLQLDK